MMKPPNAIVDIFSVSTPGRLTHVISKAFKMIRFFIAFPHS